MPVVSGKGRAARGRARKAAPVKRKPRPRKAVPQQIATLGPAVPTAIVRRLDWLRSEAISQSYNPARAIQIKREIIAEIERLPFTQRAREMGFDPARISEKELAERIDKHKRQIDETEKSLTKAKK